MYKKNISTKVTKNKIEQWQVKCAGFFFAFFLLFVNVASADFPTFIANFNKLIINPLIVLLFAVAVVYFLYGVFGFISNQESEDKRASGQRHMIWGLVGIVIMMGVFTLLDIVLDLFGIGGVDIQGGTVTLPPL